jgi:hypothetical protein
MNLSDHEQEAFTSFKILEWDLPKRFSAQAPFQNSSWEPKRVKRPIRKYRHPKLIKFPPIVDHYILKFGFRCLRT